MERKGGNTEMKRILLTAIFFTMLLPVNGQGVAIYNRRLYQSYIQDEMYLWKGILAEMNREYDAEQDPSLLYDLCFTYYGYIGYLISQEEDKVAKTFLDKAMERTDELEKSLDGRADVLALQGALIGYRLVLSKFTTMFQGPKALKYINAAFQSADTCFNCNVEMGNMKFYTPKMLGGDKTEAIRHYKKAVDLLETSKLKTEHNWIYINTVLLLANAYKETGQEELACKLYKQMLEYEPAADWIRKDLYSKCKSP
jgi:tetratricopeptide (TPR) repeat protein